MGGGASTRADIQYAKVEVLPAANTGGRSSGLWSSRNENAGANFRIDDAGVIVGCSAKVIESLAEATTAGTVSRSEGGAMVVPDGTMARVDSSLGNEFEELCGFRQGSQVPRHVFADKSHSQLLVTKSRFVEGGGKEDKAGSPQYYVVPRLEPFSRISGICKILGDRECPSKEKHVLRVGDFVRIGSVGLVVTETSTSLSAPPESITAEQLWYLKPRAFAVVTPHETAAQRLCGQAIVSEPGSKKAPRAPPVPVSVTQKLPPPSGEVRRARHRLVGQLGEEGKDSEDEQESDEGPRASGHKAVPANGGGGCSDTAGASRGGGGSDSEDEDANAVASPTLARGGAESEADARGAQSGEAKEADEEVAMCYVCCDDDAVGPENPLVSACSCLGGTRWLHLQCLQRLLGSNGPQAPCVVFRNQNRNLICKVCRSEYLKQVELTLPAEVAGPGGKPAAAPSKVVIPIPQPSMRPPYICFKVVTHNAHNTFQDSIFNSFYHVSFAPLVDPVANEPTSQPPPLPGFSPTPAALDDPSGAGGGASGSAAEPGDAGQAPQDPQQQASVVPNARRPLVLGRSMDSDMQLNYQTVSGHHAALYYEGGQFSIQDLRSSNGTFVYLKDPLPLAPSSSVRIRMGRKTLRISSVASTVKVPPSSSSSSSSSSLAAAGSKDSEAQAKEESGAKDSAAAKDVKEMPPGEAAAAAAAADGAGAKAEAPPGGLENAGLADGNGQTAGNLPTIGQLKSLMVVARPSTRPVAMEGTATSPSASGQLADHSPPDGYHMFSSASPSGPSQVAVSGERPHSAPPSASFTPTAPANPPVAAAAAAGRTDPGAADAGEGRVQPQRQEEGALDDDGNEEDDELEARTPRLVPGDDGPVLTFGGGGTAGSPSGGNEAGHGADNGGGGGISDGAGSSSNTGAGGPAQSGGGGAAATQALPASSSPSVMQVVRETFTRVTVSRPNTTEERR